MTWWEATTTRFVIEFLARRQIFVKIDVSRGQEEPENKMNVQCKRVTSYPHPLPPPPLGPLFFSS